MKEDCLFNYTKAELSEIATRCWSKGRRSQKTWKNLCRRRGYSLNPQSRSRHITGRDFRKIWCERDRPDQYPKNKDRSPSCHSKGEIYRAGKNKEPSKGIFVGVNGPYSGWTGFFEKVQGKGILPGTALWWWTGYQADHESFNGIVEDTGTLKHLFCEIYVRHYSSTEKNKGSIFCCTVI